MLDTLLGLALCLAALVCAWHVPGEQRGEVRFAALVFCAGWVLYISAWFPAWFPGVPSVADLFNELPGVYFTNEQLWPFFDALCAGLIILGASVRPWAWSLWLLYVLQIVSHGIHVGIIPDQFGPYSAALDGLFYVQVFVFLWIGGRHVADRLRNTDWLRVLGRPARQGTAREGGMEA